MREFRTYDLQKEIPTKIKERGTVWDSKPKNSGEEANAPTEVQSFGLSSVADKSNIEALENLKKKLEEIENEQRNK